MNKPPYIQGLMWARIATKFKVNPKTGCWEWNGACHEQGYGRMKLPNTRKNIPVHRYILEAKTGTSGQLACHSCDNPPCINPDHLFWGTYADNYNDCRNKGRNLFGEKSPNSRLSEKTVREILAAEGTQVEVAKRFGISHSHVGNLRRKKRWGHIHDSV